MLGWWGCQRRVKKFRTLRKKKYLSQRPIASNHIPHLKQISPFPSTPPHFTAHSTATIFPHISIPQLPFIMYVLPISLWFLHCLIHPSNIVSVGSLSAASPFGLLVKPPSPAALVHCRQRSSLALSLSPTVALIIFLSCDHLSLCCRFVTTQHLISLNLLLLKMRISLPTLSTRALTVVLCPQQRWSMLETSSSMLPQRPWARSSRNLVTFLERRLSMIRGV